MSDVNTIDHIEWAEFDGFNYTALPDPVPVIVPGSPTTTRVLKLYPRPKDADGDDVSTSLFSLDWKIQDPKGNYYGGFASSWERNSFPVCLVGTFNVTLVVGDTAGAKKTFTTSFDTATQYNSGGGVMKDIPLDAAGNIRPIYEWKPNREGGYYNNGMAVFSTGTPTPYSSNYHCDIITKICRPKYLGTPPGAIDGYPVVAGTPPHHADNSNYIRYNRIPQPLRKIPAALLAHKQGSQQSTCWCWAIKPKLGDWEGYTSLNRNIDLPEYTDHLGNTVPAMTYLCAAGISPTSMPVRTSLVKDGIDVTVLAFDRGKLQRKYYVGAEFEYFEINYNGDLSGRWVAQAGFLGNTKMGDSQATVEMVPWADLLNRPQGRELPILCDVGLMHGEDFGTGRCRNQVLQDGPDIDDWTVSGAIAYNVQADVSQMTNFTLDTKAVSGNDIPDGFTDHLEGGKVEFTSGPNEGVIIGIRKVEFFFTFLTTIRFQGNLPFQPTANDTFKLTVGCRRTTADCVFFNNIANFRGMPYVPGQEGVIRRYRED